MTVTEDAVTNATYSRILAISEVTSPHRHFVEV